MLKVDSYVEQIEFSTTSNQQMRYSFRKHVKHATEMQTFPLCSAMSWIPNFPWGAKVHRAHKMHRFRQVNICAKCLSKSMNISQEKTTKKHTHFLSVMLAAWCFPRKNKIPLLRRDANKLNCVKIFRKKKTFCPDILLAAWLLQVWVIFMPWRMLCERLNEYEISRNMTGRWSEGKVG